MTGDETAARRAAVADALYPEHAAAVLRALRAGVSYRTADGGRHMYRVESAFEAEDVCHEAMAVVLRQIGSGAFQIDRPVRPYLLRIAAHLALRRARRAHREVLFGDAANEPPEVAALGRSGRRRRAGRTRAGLSGRTGRAGARRAGADLRGGREPGPCR